MAAIIGAIVVAVIIWLGSRTIDQEANKKLVIKDAPLVPQWEQTARKTARAYDLPWQIILAQIWQESKGDKDAIGGSGEIGLMQLKQIAIDDLRLQGYGEFPGWDINPEMNVLAGTAYLHLQLSRTGKLADALGRVRADALEAYNEGYAGAVKDVGPDEYTNLVIDKAQVLGW